MGAARQWMERARADRRAALVVVHLRLLLGFAFLPAGLKKVLGQPFTDPDKTGPFHEFLRAFFATGAFYRFVGGVQLVAALLMMTQFRAGLGAAVAFPVLTAIVVLCWSTAVVPTAVVTSAMWMGLVLVLLWDGPAIARLRPSHHGPVDARPYAGCGVAVAASYLIACGWVGAVYRPRGADFGEPAFYVLAAMPLLPISAWWWERRRRAPAR